MSSGARIAVIGAGPMGLAVAYQLALDGHCPVVFEADDRVGGMTACFDFGGLEIERYYHFHCTSDLAFLRLINELGIAHQMRWVATRMGYWYRNQLQPWGTPLALLRFKGIGPVAKFRYGLHAFLSVHRNDWGPLDRLDAVDWIRRWVGEEAYEVLWRKLFDFKFYDQAKGLSAAWIWSRIRRIGRSRSDLFNEKLGYLEGGSETLLKALRSAIEAHGGEVRLGMPVERVLIKDGAVIGVRVNGCVESFARVVSTVPVPLVPHMMPDLPAPLLAKYRALKNIAVVCVIARLSRQVTENFWLNTNDPEMDIPGIVEYTNLRPLDEHVVYVPFYMPAEHAKFRDVDSVFCDKVRRYLRKINPELGDGDFLGFRVSRYRYAQPICETGHMDRLPPVRLPIDGLWVADTSYYYPEDRGISESVAFGRILARKLET